MRGRAVSRGSQAPSTTRAGFARAARARAAPRYVHATDEISDDRTLENTDPTGIFNIEPPTSHVRIIFIISLFLYNA